jgi:hypothetical protein
MFNRVFARWSILIGISMSVLGITLYSQLDRIVDFHMGIAVLNTAAILSHSMTLLGLLATLIGAAAWARRAPLVHALLSGVFAGVLALLLDVFLDVNIHGPSAILIYVILAGTLGCVVILLITAIRFLSRDGSTNTTVS